VVVSPPHFVPSRTTPLTEQKPNRFANSPIQHLSPALYVNEGQHVCYYVTESREIGPSQPVSFDQSFAHPHNLAQNSIFVEGNKILVFTFLSEVFLKVDQFLSLHLKAGCGADL